MKRFLAVLLLTISGVCFSDELKLFDITLQDASRAELKNAILKAGGRVISSNGYVDKYNASKLGLPGVKNLTVLFSGDKFVLAQYSFSDYFNEEEILRRMLIEKYGLPDGSKNESNRRIGYFGDKYISDGVYFWKYAEGMELQFRKPFGISEAITISYVNTKEKLKLDTQMETVEQERIRRQAVKNRNSF